MAEKKTSTIFKIIKWFVVRIYPKYEVIGTENLPQEPAIFVGNHSQLHGPLACELYFPVDRRTWCAGQMMELKEVPAYAYQDFWSGKPKGIRWLYKGLSYLIAPLAVCLFNNAQTIGVYHDSRILSTFKNTVKCLQSGTGIVIFPECYTEHNHIVHEFQRNFVDVARLYYKRSGLDVPFVPVYVAPNRRELHIGKPTYFDHNVPMEQERERVCNYLMDEITSMAVSLPAHTVVPYPNIPKKDYPSNLPEQRS